jgi:hypothetical protein
MAGTKEGDVMEQQLQKLRSRLHRNRVLAELIQIAAVSFLMGVFTFVFALDESAAPMIISGVFFVGSVGLAVLLGRFKKPSAQEITRFLDRKYPFMEESASLLTSESSGSLIENWQKEIISNRLRSEISQIKLPKEELKKASAMGGLWLAISLILIIAKPVLNQSLSQFQNQTDAVTEERNEQDESTLIPEIEEVRIKISPPSYTGLGTEEYEFENISVPEGATINWSVKVNETLENVSVLFSNGESIEMNVNGDPGIYSALMTGSENRIYQIRLTNADTTVFSSFKSIEVITDQPPGFVVLQPTAKRDFITPQKRTFNIEAEIGDDHGVTETEIRATLAKGSGENVRFREHTFSFAEISGLGSKKVIGRSRLNADSLEMEPGDELYFYITARDNKPEPQLARSDTYFIIYADSGEVSTIEVAGLGVDLLPEYFRSQRQIIIDTEQLLEDKPNISKDEFNDRSESIGHDQNLLRQRYGEYLGQEDEMASSTGGSMGASAETGAEEHDAGAEEGHDHEEEELNGMGLTNAESEATSVIPDEFFHDHGAAEMNTLFAQSPRAMLKEAVDNMWNAELYLSTRRPEEALPYEYAALELLKAVQQANRQYTRKAGYELPPIDEDEKRLTGTYDDFADPDGSQQMGRPENPLVQLQLLVRDESLSGQDLAEEARGLLAEAEISDANRLFLLNRIRTIENEGRDKEIEDQITQLISEISSEIQLDPTPKTYPSIRKIQSQR